MTTNNQLAMSQSSPFGGTEGGPGMKPLKKRKEFFEHLEEGLQAYFDKHDPEWGGILHLTVGVRFGEVGGIIKSETTLRYEGYSRQRIEQILRFVLPRYVKRTEVDYAVDDVISELMGVNTAEPKGEDLAPTVVEVQHVAVEPQPEKKTKRKYPKKAKDNETTQEETSKAE